MSEISMGWPKERRPAPSHIIQKIRTEMPKPSADRTRISDVLRLAKGGYSRCRRRYPPAKSPQK